MNDEIEDALNVLARVISPSSAIETLRSRGVNVSERSLRQKARELGAFRQIGNAMFFLPEDLERIFAPPVNKAQPRQKRRKERQKALIEARPQKAKTEPPTVPPLPFVR